jgi:quercetin dioxygenase-like cupin family protein
MISCTTTMFSGRFGRCLVATTVCLVAGLASGSANAEGSRAPSVAPVPYFVKTAASLADLEKTLEGKGSHGGDLLKPGATALEIVWRHEEDHEGKELELHDGKDHVFFVTDGQATFTLGGTLLEPREISAGEWRAAKSRDSQTADAHKGDLIFIPHGTVHGRSAKGRRFTMLQLSFWPNGAPAPTLSAPAPKLSVPAAKLSVPAAKPSAPAAKPSAPAAPATLPRPGNP